MGEFSAYAQRLKREEAARKVSLIITTLAVLCNSFATLAPPSPANTVSPNDLISGGVANKEVLIEKYNSNERNFRDILALLGITRDNLETATEGTVSLQNAAHITGRTANYSYGAGEREYTFEKKNGDIGTVYLYKTENLGVDKKATYPAFISTSDKLGRIAILKTSGNVAFANIHQTTSEACEFTPSLSPTDTLCRPCPGTSDLWVSNPECPTPFVFNKTAANVSQQGDITAAAQSSDRITYTIRAQNVSSSPASIEISDKLDDVLEYANILDTGGGVYDPHTSSLAWPNTEVAAGETITQTFSVRIKTHIPATAQGTSNPTSFDCTMSNTHGNTLRIDIECPASKYVESTAQLLPRTPNTTSFLAGVGLFFATLYFYARARQLREEVRLIRKDINTGVIS